MPLSAATIKNAKPAEKTRRLFDEKGLYLEILPNGARYWRWKYRIGGREKRLALGVFPEVSLADARQRRDDARTLLRNQRDPAAERRALKARQRAAASTTFGVIADEWFKRQRPKWSPATIEKTNYFLEIAKPLRSRPIQEITSREILDLLRRVEKKGINETAHRVKGRLGEIFRYAIASDRADNDPTVALRGALAPVVTRHRPGITNPSDLATLLSAIAGYTGQPTTRTALMLAPMLFVRPGNLRAMEWSEINLGRAEWRIPARKMKVRETHLVPLASQAVDLLKALHSITGGGAYCFPSLRTGKRCMSENTVNAALRRLGYRSEQVCGHGFRTTATTMLSELGWSVPVIERQMAHAERNKVRAAYSRAEYVEERRKMMQAWADHLDSLKNATEAVRVG
jgi:integrase